MRVPARWRTMAHCRRRPAGRRCSGRLPGRSCNSNRCRQLRDRRAGGGCWSTRSAGPSLSFPP